MPATLVHDIILQVVDNLQDEPWYLLSCMLVSKTWFDVAVPLMWRRPINQVVNGELRCRNRKQRRALVIAYLACLPAYKRRPLKPNVRVLRRNATVNYAVYLKELSDNLLYDLIYYSRRHPKRDSTEPLYTALWSFFMRTSVNIETLLVDCSFAGCFSSLNITSSLKHLRALQVSPSTFLACNGLMSVSSFREVSLSRYSRGESWSDHSAFLGRALSTIARSGCRITKFRLLEWPLTNEFMEAVGKIPIMLPTVEVVHMNNCLERWNERTYDNWLNARMYSCGMILQVAPANSHIREYIRMAPGKKNKGILDLAD